LRKLVRDRRADDVTIMPYGSDYSIEPRKLNNVFLHFSVGMWRRIKETLRAALNYADNTRKCMKKRKRLSGNDYDSFSGSRY
jgi:hypothetical protein